MDNSLKKIISGGLASLSSVFKPKPASQSAIGIDIGASSIKVVQLKRKGGKAILETYGAISLGPYAHAEVGQATNLDIDGIVKALLDVIKESNVTTNNAVMSIPSSSSLIFTLSLPPTVTEDTLAGIVPTEVRKYIPVPASEISLDWFMIPQEAESYEETTQSQTGSTTPTPERKTEVLVVAIHNDILTRYQDILKKTELSSDSFEMEVFSEIRATFDHDVAPVLLMDFGALKTKISIIETGIVRMFHVVNRGSQDITNNIAQSLSMPFPEAEKLKRSTGLDSSLNQSVAEIIGLSTDYIFSDTNSVVLAYEKKYNKTISKIILTGGGSLLKGLLERAKESFHAEVIRADPFGKVEAPAFLEPVLQLSGPEFAVAIGLALRQLS